MKPIFNHKKLIFNNYLAEDLGFVVVEGSPEILAQENYEVVLIEGSSSSLIINQGTYPDIEKTFTITAVDYIDNDDIEGMMNNIKKWFFDTTDNRLFYAFENKYNIVKKVRFDENIRTSFEEFGDFQVTFLCEPFYYAVEDIQVIEKTSSISDTVFTFNNDGDFESEPIIKIYGSGSINFNLNGVNIAATNVSSAIEIDTKLLEYTGGNLTVDFPTLKKGENTVIIPATQNITKIEITPRTIYR